MIFKLVKVVGNHPLHYNVTVVTVMLALDAPGVWLKPVGVQECGHSTTPLAGWWGDPGIPRDGDDGSVGSPIQLRDGLGRFLEPGRRTQAQDSPLLLLM